MVDAILDITIDGERIHPELIEDLTMNFNIADTIPSLKFIINDTRGDFWSKLRFGIGSLVRVVILSTDISNEGSEKKGDSLEALNFTPFIITRLYNGLEERNTTMGGFIQVWCEQSWRFYQNYNDHAYEKQKLSKLIKKICKNTNTEAAINVDDDNFAESLDSGSIRYKTGIGDLDFIERKLLPYTLIGESNVYFFLDQYSSIHLSSFEKLYAKEPVALLTSSDNTLSNEISGENTYLKDYISDKNYKGYIPCEVTISNIGSKINITEMIGQLNEKLYIQNNQTDETILGWQAPSVKSGSNSGNNKKAYTPVINKIVESTDATSASIFEHHVFEDQVALSRNNDIVTNDMLTLVVAYRGYNEKITLGSTIDYWTPPQKEVETELDENGENKMKQSDPKYHWLNGKWLVSKVVVGKFDTRNAKTYLKLIKPTFTINKKTTTLEDVRSFYMVGGL